MRKGPGSGYEKWNISVVICDTDIPSGSTKSWWRPQNFRSDNFNLSKRNPWPKEKVQKNKHTYKTKDRVTRTHGLVASLLAATLSRKNVFLSIFTYNTDITIHLHKSLHTLYWHFPIWIFFMYWINPYITSNTYDMVMIRAPDNFLFRWSYFPL